MESMRKPPQYYTTHAREQTPEHWDFFEFDFFLKMRWICLLFECLVLLGIGVQPLYLFMKTGE